MFNFSGLSHIKLHVMKIFTNAGTWICNSTWAFLLLISGLLHVLVKARGQVWKISKSRKRLLSSLTTLASIAFFMLKITSVLKKFFFFSFR